MKLRRIIQENTLDVSMYQCVSSMENVSIINYFITAAFKSSGQLGRPRCVKASYRAITVFRVYCEVSGSKCTEETNRLHGMRGDDNNMNSLA